MSQQNNVRAKERRKTAREKVVFSDLQRLDYVNWFEHLRSVEKTMDDKKEKFRACRISNNQCTMPDKVVKSALIYIFLSDDNCLIKFDDENRVVTLHKV